MADENKQGTVTTTSADELIKKCEAKMAEFSKHSGTRGMNPHIYIENVIKPTVAILKRGVKPERVDEAKEVTELRNKQYAAALVEAVNIDKATVDVIKVAVYEQPSPSMKPTHASGEKVIKPVVQ